MNHVRLSLVKALVGVPNPGYLQVGLCRNNNPKTQTLTTDKNVLILSCFAEDRWAQRMAARAWAILSLVVGALLIIVAMFGTKCLGAAADSAADNASKSTSKNKSKRMGA